MSEPKKRKRAPDKRKGSRHTPEAVARKRKRTVEIVCKSVEEKERWERHVSNTHATHGEAFQLVLDAAGVARLGGLFESAIDDRVHIGSVNRGEVEKKLADVLIVLLRMANTIPGGEINLSRAVEDRIAEKFPTKPESEQTEEEILKEWNHAEARVSADLNAMFRAFAKWVALVNRERAQRIADESMFRQPDSVTTFGGRPRTK